MVKKQEIIESHRYDPKWDNPIFPHFKFTPASSSKSDLIHRCACADEDTHRWMEILSSKFYENAIEKSHFTTAVSLWHALILVLAPRLHRRRFTADGPPLKLLEFGVCFVMHHKVSARQLRSASERPKDVHIAISPHSTLIDLTVYSS